MAFCTFTAGMAQATCTQVGNSINCFSPPTDNTVLLFDVTASTTATANNWVMNGGQFHLRGNGADAAFNGSNVTATNGTGGNNGVIHVSTINTGGNATLNINNATIEQLMSGHGIAAHSAGASGNASVSATDTHITLNAAAGNGNAVVATGSGDTSINFIRGSITAANNGSALIASTNVGNVDIKVQQGGMITITGTGADANAIRGRNGGNGTVYVENDHDLSSVVAALRTIAANGQSTIINSGAIQTNGTNGYGIHSSASGSGSIGLTNSGVIQTSGADAHGIYGKSVDGQINIDNTNAITVNNARGILAESTNGVLQVTGNGTITVNSQNAGILAEGGNDASVDYSGDITGGGTGISVISDKHASLRYTNANMILTTGSGYAAGLAVNGASAEVFNSGHIVTNGDLSYGISGSSQQLVIENQGVVQTNGVVSDGILGQAGDGTVTIKNGGKVTAWGERAFGIHATAVTDGSASVVNNAGAEIHGGWGDSFGGGVGMQAKIQSVDNAGLIDALNDQAVVFDLGPYHYDSAKLTNSGVMTGSVNAGMSVVSVDNSGQWNLRNFADTNGDQSRDTLAVAVSDFGSSGNNVITNSGVIALLGDNGQATTLDSNGAYSTGYAANTMAKGGAVQGQILNVKTFTNSGTIDLGPANPAVGDVLVISGGNTPGVSGGGTYVANGGRIVLDTVLNEGGANSQSDMLVVDSTQLGGAADKIAVINAGGAGALTQGNGIELVRVLDKDRSASGVFKLDGRVVAGAYDYDLYQGGVGADAGDGNWYLRNIAQGGNGVRAETGVYLRNMSAASGMFMHTLHDRLGEPQYTDAYQDQTNGKVASLWVRVVGNHTDGQAANGAIDMSTDTTLVHVGGDLARWSTDGQDRWQFGLMGAYGQSDTDANATHGLYTPSGYKRTANGKVEGYGAGAYLTWYGNKDKPTGPYVDLWTMYGWYSNKVQGNQLAQEKYDSTNWTTSIEGGYAFVAHDGDQSQWMIEPQAQLAYNSYSADNHREQNGTWVTDGNQDGIVTRLGARAYSRSKLGDNGMQPFVEANWWHGTAQNSLRFNGDLVDDDTPKDTFELKAGLQGEIAKNWQLWGHVGGRWGQNSYSSYEVY